jgi:cytidylate kinase
MASVVFPEATLKVFLTASAEERARRRYKQLIEKGMSANLHALLDEISERDARDAGRSVAPMGLAPGAERLDTTGMNPEEARDRILRWFGEPTRG